MKARLLGRRAAAEALGISPRNVWEYCDRWPALRAGTRIIRVDPSTAGRRKVLSTAIEEHQQVESLLGAGSLDEAGAPLAARREKAGAK